MDIRSVDLNLLVVLDALLSERSVSRAAERLRLSQSATSAALARLRQLFGDPLLVRTAAGMVPTAKAMDLEMPVRVLIGDIERVVVPAQPFNPRASAMTFTIAASDYVEFTVLPRLLELFQARAPETRLGVKPMDIERIGRQLEVGEVDLALLSTANAPPDVRSRPLYSERFVIVARQGHPRVHDQIDIDTICQLDHVMVSPRGGGFTGATDEALAQIGRKRRVRLSVPHYLLVPEMVIRSDMIATMPERLARGYAGRLNVLEPPLAIRGFTIAQVWHERTHRDPAQQWLRRAVVDLAAALAEWHAEPGPTGSGAGPRRGAGVVG